MSGKITERMEAVVSDLEKQFTNLYCKKDFEYQLQLIERSAKSRKPQEIKKLAKMYREVGIDCKDDQALSYYKKLFSTLQVSETVEDVNNKIINMMCSLYAEYPKPEEFMERIVNGLDPDTMLSGSLELRILRKILQTVNVQEITNYNGNYKYYSETLKQRNLMGDIDESIFDVLNNRPTGHCDFFQLVQACYNLAHGIFISRSSTKELLFLFAFAYDMRYYTSREQSDYNELRDVEKNLFIDYYCDNLTRFLVSNTGASDMEPTGIVINPKNFVDIVFIYFLNQDNLSAGEKAIGFYATIANLKETWNVRKGFHPERKSNYENIATKNYKNRLNENFFAQPVDEMKDFLLDNYYCDTQYVYGNNRIGTQGFFELPFTTNSAYKQYQDILSLLKSNLSLSEDADFSEIYDRIDYRSSFLKDNTNQTEKHADFATNSDIKYQIELKQWYKKETIEVMRAIELKENIATIGEESFFNSVDPQYEDQKGDFIRIMKNVAKKLEPEPALCVKDASSITRTKIIAAYYHYFCLEIGYDAAQTGMWKSFKDVYDDMRDGISEYLDNAGYQKISSKNLFDVFVIFLAYCKVNDFLN
jgi:hypothetical protein